MSGVYVIRTVSDMTKIPLDRIDDFLIDLGYALDMAHFTAGDDFDPADMLTELTWTDDGNHSVTMSGADGDPILKLEVEG